MISKVFILRKLLHKLKLIYLKEEFDPFLLGVITNPFYLPRRRLRRCIKEYSEKVDNSKSLIDVGCGSKPYKKLFNSKNYVGIDIQNEGHDHSNEDIDVFYDGKKFPFEDRSFEIALCNQVLEHVFNPEEFIGEISRVLKNNGKLILTVPFLWDEHEKPFDYARYSSYGIKHLLERNGFEVIDQKKTNSHFGIIFIILNMILFKLFLSKSVKLNLLTNTLILFPINVLSVLFSIFNLKSQDLYIDNVVFAQKKHKQ